MARFHVYAIPEGPGYVVDVQADAMAHFNTRVVIPLLPAANAPVPARILNPVFDLPGGQHVLVTQYMAAMPAKLLKAPLASIEDRRDEVVAAIDLLFRGF